VVKERFANHFLSSRLIVKMCDQLIEMGYTGNVCLSHFNEPLLDKMIGRIARLFHGQHRFHSVYFHTNGDFLDEAWAKDLDGSLNRIVVSLYMDDPLRTARAKQIQGMFTQTKIDIVTSPHLTTHFSPNPDRDSRIEAHKQGGCKLPETTCIINYRGQYLLCCEDMTGEFNLGTFPETGIADYWYGDKHVGVMGSVRGHPYCQICPKG
jgi:hypothetical protein